MVKDLIAIAPQMTFIPDSEGSYPMHIAIRNHHSHETINEIFKAFPEMGRIQDLKTSLLPFMLAGVGNWENEKDQTTVTYQLLREDPHLIFGL